MSEASYADTGWSSRDVAGIRHIGAMRVGGVSARCYWLVTSGGRRAPRCGGAPQLS